MEEISEWKPVINQVHDYALDGRIREGSTYLHSALGVSLDSRLTEVASCLEPLEQSVVSSSLVARPIEGITQKLSDWKPVINPVQYITPDGRPMEGTDKVDSTDVNAYVNTDLLDNSALRFWQSDALLCPPVADILERRSMEGISG